MKRVVYLLISLLLLNCSSTFSKQSSGRNDPSRSDSLNVVTTPDLYNLTMKWAQEYGKLFPGVRIKVKNVSEAAKAGELINEGSIGFISNENYPGLKSESMWKIVVGRDVIVPVINSQNPFLEEIDRKGISPEAIVSFLGKKDSGTWGTLLKDGKSSPANFYCINDETVVKSLAGFLQTGELNFTRNKTENAEGMISAIQKDKLAFGFCRITDILDHKNQNIVENIRLLPIDRNGNGAIDYNEKIYEDFNLFSRGVWIGKYPKALISSIYTVTSAQPENESEIAFLKWVLNDGQQYLFGNGYADLLVSERQSAGDKLYNAKIYTGTSDGGSSMLKLWLFIIATVILAGLIVDTIARQRKRRKEESKVTGPVHQQLLDEKSLLIPNGLYFDKTHTWAFMEQNGIVKVGIDDFLQHITGTITRIKMKSPGKKIKKGDQILSVIQNGKQLNLYSPVSGTIIEQNASLAANTSAINSSPYNDGWIYRIEPANWVRESQLLFMADRYRQFIKNEFSRLKDFMAAALKDDTEHYSLVLLQDGGELADGVLAEMGPEVWEDFQTNFIDPSRQVWFYDLV